MQFDQIGELASGCTQDSGDDDSARSSTEFEPNVTDSEQKLLEALNENIGLLEEEDGLQKNVEDLAHSLNRMQIRTAVDQYDLPLDLINGTLESDCTPASASIEDITLPTSEADPDVTDLEQKLNDALNENSKLLEANSKLRKDVQDLTRPLDEMRMHTAIDQGPDMIEEQVNMLRKLNQLMKNDYGLDFNTSNFEVPAAFGSVQANVSASFSGRPRISTDFGGLAITIDLSQTFANASCADILHVSINTSEDVHIVKVKLESLKDILVSMFERLRGSASVLDEVYKYLSNGSAENKAIADKIRQMNLEFSALSFEDSAVERAVAEKSMSQLQDNLSVHEQSLNQSASFILDTTRRFSNAHNLSRMQQGPEVISNDANEELVVELQEKIAVTEASLQEMKALVSQTKTKLVEVTKARDDALSCLDSLGKKIEDVLQDNLELNTNEQLASGLENAQEAVSSLNTQTQELTEANLFMKHKTEDLEQEISRSHKNCDDKQQQCQQLEEKLHSMPLSEKGTTIPKLVDRFGQPLSELGTEESEEEVGYDYDEDFYSD